jgi:hypothetical protein
MPLLSADNSTLIIRGINNCLIALAQADMFQKLDKPEHAKELVTEGMALLEVAKKLEIEQSARARRAKNLTVAGDSLAEMVDAVCARCGVWTLDYVLLARDFIRRNYQQVYDSTLWTESTVEIDKASVTGVLILPEYVDRIIAIRGDSNLGQLSAEQPAIFFAVNPWIFEQTGSPLGFSYLTSVAISKLPPTAEPLRLYSDVATDKSKVFVRGETATGLVTETITLNGTTFVTSTYSYLVVLNCSKELTSGNVVVVGDTSGLPLSVIPPNVREQRFIRIQLRPTPTANVTCKILCKRKITPLVQDEDTPLLRDIGNVLINLAASDMFAKLGKDKAAADAKTKADGALKTLIDLERNQGANSFQIIPEVESTGAEWADSDWLVAKY